MALKLMVWAILVGGAWLGSWLSVSAKKRAIAPIESRWLNRWPGHVPHAAIMIAVYAAVVIWAVFQWPFRQQASDLYFLGLVSLGFFSGMPWWWEYRGKGGYLVGGKLIRQASVVGATRLPGRFPVLVIRVRRGGGEADLRVRVPAEKG